MRAAYESAGRRAAFGAVLVCMVAGCARFEIAPSSPPGQPAAVEAPGERASGEPWAGLVFEPEASGGARVAIVHAGPAAAAGLVPGDVIVSVGGVAADPPALVSRIDLSVPGDVLSLRVARGARTFGVDVVLGRRQDWMGPSAWPNALSSPPLADESPGWYETAHAEMLAVSAAAGTADGALSRMFARLAEDDSGFNKLPAVRSALISPHDLTARERRVMRELRALSAGRRVHTALFCDLLAIECAPQDAAPPPTARDLASFASAIETANTHVVRAFARVAGGRTALAADVAYLVEQTAAGQLIHAQPEAPRALRAMRASMEVDFPELAAALEALLANAYEASAYGRAGKAALPDGLAEGTVRDWTRVGDGFVVVGDDGPNRYDMDRIDAVIDAGGDDVYVWQGVALRATQIIVDFGGNDRYEGAYGGPGAGWLGAAVLIDHAGEDVYRAVFGGCGAGVFGFGVLIDASGSDTYRCDAWSLGAGLYGGGLVMDAGTDGDAYLSQTLSQGVGGPRGAGLLVEAGGADLYRANGQVGSAYGTPAVFLGFSQGIGFGIRPHDHGGIGALLDVAGDDRYEGGEFSQGGGYFWGLGMLHDGSGDDLYYGNRYAQGFAAHQSAGILSDLAGDDVYWSMTAAAQGAAWDQSVALLVDVHGDDHYRASDLSQGAAAHHSRAWLHDAGGDDVYWSDADRAQGAAGANDYHADTADAYSLGVIFDRAGSDTYSTGLVDGEARIREGAGADGAGWTGVAFDRR